MKTIETLNPSPFRHLISTIGELPTSFTESMSYYELLAWLCDFLEKKVLPTVNTNAEALKELQDYVVNYFDNLDVQEEINNKLDEMAESGQLADIIAAYLEIRSILAYDNVEAMKASDNLSDGSFAETYGFHSKGDGGGAKYLIREIKNTDVVDGKKVIALDADNLVAVLLANDEIKIGQVGGYGDGIHDDSEAFQYAVDNFRKVTSDGKITRIENTVTVKTDSACQKIFDINFLGDTPNNAYIVKIEKDNVNIEGCYFKGDCGNFVRLNEVKNVGVYENIFDGSFGSTVSPVVAVSSSSIAINDNKFIDSDGFNIQMLFSKNSSIAGNTFTNPHFDGTLTTSSSTSTVTFSSPVYPKRYAVYVNGTILSSSDYEVEYNDGTVTITFDDAIESGSSVHFRCYKSLECININSNSKNITVIGNTITGSGDSGIVVGADYHNGVLDPSNVDDNDLPRGITITANSITDIAYSGVALTHHCSNVSITANNISNCGWCIDGSVYDAGVFLPQQNAKGIVVANNTFYNTVTTNDDEATENGVMSFGISINPLSDNTNQQLADYLASNEAPRIYGNNIRNVSKLYDFHPTSNVYSQCGLKFEPIRVEIESTMPTSTTQTDPFETIGTNSATINVVSDNTLADKNVFNITFTGDGYVSMASKNFKVAKNCKITAGFWAKSSDGTGRIDFVYIFDGHNKTNRPSAFPTTEWKYYEIDLLVGSETSRTLQFRVTRADTNNTIKLADLRFTYKYF